jgi:capsular polysaccharide transport system permease protein
MEEAYRHYVRHVKIGFDPTEGIVKMEVIAADPEVSAAFSRALIAYAEEQVDNLSLRLREDQMQGSIESFREAEAKMEAAQERVLVLQEQLGILDPQSETASVMGQISAFETQLAEKQLQLQQLLDNPAPNAARVAGARGDIARLEELIAELRAPLTVASGEGASLARISAELRMAEVDLETRTMMMQESLQQLEAARIEANRQVRYLSTGVNPIPPDEPTYPRAFENTALALLIFSGIYLMMSLTASILREQVSG